MVRVRMRRPHQSAPKRKATKSRSTYPTRSCGGGGGGAGGGGGGAARIALSPVRSRTCFSTVRTMPSPWQRLDAQGLVPHRRQWQSSITLSPSITRSTSLSMDAARCSRVASAATSHTPRSAGSGSSAPSGSSVSASQRVGARLFARGFACVEGDVPWVACAFALCTVEVTPVGRAPDVDFAPAGHVLADRAHLDTAGRAACLRFTAAVVLRGARRHFAEEVSSTFSALLHAPVLKPLLRLLLCTLTLELLERLLTKELTPLVEPHWRTRPQPLINLPPAGGSAPSAQKSWRQIGRPGLHFHRDTRAPRPHNARPPPRAHSTPTSLDAESFTLPAHKRPSRQAFAANMGASSTTTEEPKVSGPPEYDRLSS